MQKIDFSFSRILSYILHPLLIPTLAISALMLRPDLYVIVLPDQLKIWYISMVFLFTFLIPVASVLLLIQFKLVSSLEMQLRNERTIPLLIASISYMTLLFSVKSNNIPPLFQYVLYSASLALLVGLMINLAYKISLHTLGWGALTATLISISIKLGMPLNSLILLATMLSGLIGYSRLQQNAHNQTQIYLGYVAGVSIIILTSIFT